MKILVMSEVDARRFAIECKEPFAIISIVAEHEEDIEFVETDYLYGVYPMNFNDLETDFVSRGHVHPAPVQSDFFGLKKVVDNYFDSGIKTLVVHCGAGISRSAAVAQAISDYKGCGLNLFHDGIHQPNMLVYRLCRREFGIETTAEEYAELFSQNIDNS